MKTFIAIALGLISGFYIKSNYFSKIQTPNSPPTFNFTLDQLMFIVDLQDYWILKKLKLPPDWNRLIKLQQEMKKVQDWLKDLKD
jgi:hypothetical protein